MADSETEAAIVTGGTRGIGAAIAGALLKRGVRLLVNGRGRDEEVDANLAEFKRLGDVELVPGDAADPATAAALVARARERFGRLDYVVPAAGGAHPGRITDLRRTIGSRLSASMCTRSSISSAPPIRSSRNAAAPS